MQTLSSHYYAGDESWALDKERIFYRSWQFAGHVSQLPKSGDFFTKQIADESLLIVRGEDDEIRAFYNVCRHRAHRLARGHGNKRLFVCPYHAWSYRTDGQLFNAPGSDRIEGFCKETIRLSAVRLETMAGLIFVNLDDDAPGLAETFPGIAEGLLAARSDLPAMRPAYERSIDHDCNWKVSVENFSECYHCSTVHKFLTNSLYDAESYTATVEDKVFKHFMARLGDRETHGDLHCWYLWPNLAVEMFPFHRSVTIRQFLPLGPRRSSYSYCWLVGPELTPGEVDEVAEMGREYCDTTGLEDADIVEAVQQGLESRAYDAGTLMLGPEITQQSEHGVAHFQSLYRDAVGATP